MEVYKIYTNTGNHVARGSLLSDTIITKYGQQLVGASLLLAGWFRERIAPKIENVVVQETINMNITGFPSQTKLENFALVWCINTNCE